MINQIKATPEYWTALGADVPAARWAARRYEEQVRGGIHQLCPHGHAHKACEDRQCHLKMFSLPSFASQLEAHGLGSLLPLIDQDPGSGTGQER